MATMLIVEDSEHLAESLKRFFLKESYEISIAHNTKDAQNLLEKKAFDIVLLDLALEEHVREENGPEYEGFNLLAFISSNQSLSMVIVMTAHSEDDNRLKALKSGAYDFVVKGNVNTKIEEELLIKSEKALMFRKFRKKEVDEAIKRGAGIDDNQYLTINTTMLIDKFMNEKLLGIKIDDCFERSYISDDRLVHCKT